MIAVSHGCAPVTMITVITMVTGTTVIMMITMVVTGEPWLCSGHYDHGDHQGDYNHRDHHGGDRSNHDHHLTGAHKPRRTIL